MKKYTINFFALFVGFAVILFCSNCQNKTPTYQPDNTVWVDLIGQDTTIGFWPDLYANYFAYTFKVTDPNIGLKIQGEFPNARYMSYNVYNLADQSTQGSIIDVNIAAEKPFVVDDKTAGDSYTIHVIPEKYSNSALPNKLTYKAGSSVLLVIMRLYDFNEDNYGGIPLPGVTAFKLEEKEQQENIPLPSPIMLTKIWQPEEISKDFTYLYESENIAALDGPRKQKKYFTMPFFRVTGERMLQNNDNLYLISAITKKEKELYMVKFKAPTYVKETKDIGHTDVRYWSMMIGSDNSYSFNSIKDEDCQIDEDGFVTVVIGDNDSALKERVAALGFNFMEWNIARNKGFIIYRNMLSSKGFAGHLLKLDALREKDKKDFAKFEAGQFIGEYAPKGNRMSIEDFMAEYRLSE